MRIKTAKQLTKALDGLVREIFKLEKTPRKCFVCKRQFDLFHPKNNPYGLQVGHYITRSVFPLRWDFKNLEWNCSVCNRIHEENILPFTKAMLDAYGEERIDYLNERWLAYKQSAKSMTSGQKRDLLDELQMRIDILLKV